MVTINNQELKRAFSDSTKTQMLEQPTQVDNSKVIPIIDVTPKNHKTITFSKTATLNDATSSNVFTTDANKETYVTNVEISFAKNATATATSIAIVGTYNGGTIFLTRLRGITLTANSQSISKEFHVPVKLDKNTLVQITSDTAVSTITAHAVVSGYEEDAQ